MSSDEPWDLTILYPANYHEWADRLYCSNTEAAFLSLGIDPESVAIASEDEPRPHYGLHHGELIRRRDAIQDALEGRYLEFSPTTSGKSLLRLSDFVRWARGRAWPLPEELVRIAAAQAEPVVSYRAEADEEHARGDTQSEVKGRENGPRPESLQMLKRAEELAIELLTEDIHRAKSDIARLICRRFKATGEFDVKDKNLANRLFHHKDAPLRGSKFEEAKAIARRRKLGK
ncbi:hypothetical protein QU487_04705 [Crenobacter sp. SG2305]|uniref:hypothetical protein n=1 Tax=Crenobacter oryzisoli TaxID=3056844 RepID=UPI0025AB1E34|nr:hypothetical protein [Crenobacter sp. SG2305]MDN0082055.1 hypothetical protein [Crenobacter sp. SG2305]